MFRIKDMKVGSRLLAVFVIILQLMAAMGFVSFYIIQDITDNTIHALNTNGRLAEYSLKARANSIAMRRYEKDILLNISFPEEIKDYFKKWDDELHGGVGNVSLMEKIMTDKEGLNDIAEIKRLMNRYHDTFEGIYERIAAGEIKTAQEGNDALKEIEDEVHKLEKMFQDIAADHTENMQNINKYVANNARRAAIVIFVFMGIAVLISIILSRFITTSITRPVNLGLEFANVLAKGDLTRRIDVNQKDEIGQLFRALNEAANSIEDFVYSVMVGAQNLAQAVDQISSGNQNLSQRTSEQASSLEEIASTIEEAAATINQNADNAQQANSIAASSSQMAVAGGRLVSDAVSSINEMNQSSKKIADIITVINEISFQTNLLALNAAVEAARAGESGRGFAVVAGEVRNLAQRSGNASKEIAQLIKESIDKINIGTDLSNQSGDALREIIASVENVSKMIAEIAATSLEQKAGINQVNIAITEMDTMTQQNAALVEETASASEQMANQAQELLAMLEKFKISKERLLLESSKGHADIYLRAAHDVRKAAPKFGMKKKSVEAGDAPGKGAGAGEHVPADKDHDQNIAPKERLHMDGFEEF